MPHQLIIDTDAGVDDAIALLMALAAPTCDIAAITTVSGNVSVERVTRNIGVILDAAKAGAIPFFVGADRPLLGLPVYATHVHGEDGLGDVGFARSSRRPEPEHAAIALVRLARQNPGMYTLVALGPLTNLALALALAPELPQLLRATIIMGGAVRGRGNATAVAEFNIYADPEAAAIVFERGLKPSILSWETTEETPVAWDEWQQLLEAGPIGSSFVAPMMAGHDQRQRARNAPGVLLPDPLAVAVALEPTCAQSYSGFVTVETGHGVARGLMAVDTRASRNQAPNATIIDRVDKARLVALLAQAFQGRNPHTSQTPPDL